jgi:hypothetical protein
MQKRRSISKSVDFSWDVLQYFTQTCRNNLLLPFSPTPSQSPRCCYTSYPQTQGYRKGPLLPRKLQIWPRYDHGHTESAVSTTQPSTHYRETFVRTVSWYNRDSIVSSPTFYFCKRFTLTCDGLTSISHSRALTFSHTEVEEGSTIVFQGFQIGCYVEQLWFSATARPNM